VLRTNLGDDLAEHDRLGELLGADAYLAGARAGGRARDDREQQQEPTAARARHPRSPAGRGVVRRVFCAISSSGLPIRSVTRFISARAARCTRMTGPRRGWLLLLLAVVASASCRSAPGEVRVGSKKFTESVMLGEIRHPDGAQHRRACEHRAQLGGTQVLWHALLAGEIDLYPEYTGTIARTSFRDVGGWKRRLPSRRARPARRRNDRLSGFEDSYALG